MSGVIGECPSYMETLGLGLLGSASKPQTVIRKLSSLSRILSLIFPPLFYFPRKLTYMTTLAKNKFIIFCQTVEWNLSFQRICILCWFISYLKQEQVMAMQWSWMVSDYLHFASTNNR